MEPRCGQCNSVLPGHKKACPVIKANTGCRCSKRQRGKLRYDPKARKYSCQRCSRYL